MNKAVIKPISDKEYEVGRDLLYTRSDIRLVEYHLAMHRLSLAHQRELRTDERLAKLETQQLRTELVQLKAKLARLEQQEQRILRASDRAANMP